MIILVLGGEWDRERWEEKEGDLIRLGYAISLNEKMLKVRNIFHTHIHVYMYEK